MVTGNAEPPAASLSIVIPTLHAAATLAVTLDSLSTERTGLTAEIIVTDGGSRDATLELAEARGARIVRGPAGRGAQLAAGAAAAVHEWLLFVHADTRLEAGWAEAAANFVGDPRNRATAGVFRFALDARSAAARRLERAVAWRYRALGIPYGDQGLLIHRAFLAQIGGIRPLPIMEDVDLVRRIGRARLTLLPCAAVTSAARFERAGYSWRSLRNLFCLALYFLGLPPRLIVRIYG